jgi:hypothetical protein
MSSSISAPGRSREPTLETVGTLLIGLGVQFDEPARPSQYVGRQPLVTEKLDGSRAVIR